LAWHFGQWGMAKRTPINHVRLDSRSTNRTRKLERRIPYNLQTRHAMTTLANALKEEIRRLARKEIKATTQSMAKAVAQYRREIAKLKRQVRDHERSIAALRSQRPAAPKLAESTMRFSARSVKAQRAKTGLSAADYALLVGVSALTIYNWEHGKSRPRQEQFAALASLRGIGKREAVRRLEELNKRAA
jgi:DNA-binding transcriptional regulator YiaG